MFQRRYPSFATQAQTEKNRTPGAVAPTFTVKVSEIIILSIDSDIKKYQEANLAGFEFNVMANTRQLEIRITPHHSFDEQDRKFRNACAMLTNYRLSTRDICEIIQKYEQHLQKHNVTSGFVRKNKHTTYSQPHTHHVF